MLIASFVYVIFMFYTGYEGIEMQWRTGWAIAGVTIAIIGRTALPIMVGSFIYATDVWQWHWFFALLYIAPGLMLALPAMALMAVGVFKEKLGR